MSPGAAAVPRNAGTAAVSTTGGGGENPWTVSEGSREFTLGHVHATRLTIEEILLLAVPNLREACPDCDAAYPNRRTTDRTSATGEGDGISAADGPDGFLNFTSDDSVVIGDIVRTAKQKKLSRAYLRAGPRASLFFAPARVKAAIVTCGGLCPGLNNVVREIVLCLHDSYGVHTPVLGVQHGYWGFWLPELLREGEKGPNCPLGPPMLLTPEKVRNQRGGGGCCVLLVSMRLH